MFDIICINANKLHTYTNRKVFINNNAVKLITKYLMIKSSIIVILTFCIHSFILASIQSPTFVHYTNKEGLSSSYVKGIKQDKYGFIWVATREDISRFDGKHFVKFPVFDSLGTETEIHPQSLVCIHDSLILLESMHNYYYSFDYKLECYKPFSPLFNNIKKECITAFSHHQILFLQDYLIYELDLTTNNVSNFNLFKDYDIQSHQENFLKIASNQHYLVAFSNKNRLFILNKDNKQIKARVIDTGDPSEINFIKIDKNDNIWLEFSSNGLYRISNNTNEVAHLSTSTKIQMPHNMIHCIIVDQNNRTWIGTENGLCIWNEETNEIGSFKYDRKNPQGINTNPIYNAFMDKEGNIWLGTYFGGINFWSNKVSKFKLWESGTSDLHLGGKVISSFAEDKLKNIWIGTEDMGVNMLNTTTGHIEKVTESLKYDNLSFENVLDILFINDNELWIATYSGGINILNTKTNNIRHLQFKEHPGIGSDYIYALTQKNNTIYIGSNSGISTFNTNTNQLKRFFEHELSNEVITCFSWKEDTLWFCSYENVYSYNSTNNELLKHPILSSQYGFNQVFTSKKGHIWIATNNNGLILYDHPSQKLRCFNKKTGFPTNRIFAIEQDNDENIWVSTNNGLIHLNPTNGDFTHYDGNSGVPFNQFNYRAALKSSDGKIFFGGNEGMVSVNPNYKEENGDPNIQFTALSLFNKHVYPGDKSPLATSILNSKRIHLKYNQNTFTINYASINYTHKDQTSYAYKLEGFENEYNYVGNRTNATYTNLDPGKYTFLVKVSNDAWISESTPKKVNIIIKQPWWLTPFALVAYALVFLFVILILNQISINMQKSKAALALERQERLHEEEINNFKLEFFTNISHEIKTPLTLILGPLSSLLEEKKIDEKVKQTLSRIYLNVNRLNELLSELMEFRKIDKESVHFHVNKFYNLSFIKNIDEAFQCIAEHRNISFSSIYNNKPQEIWVNKAIIEKIIFNLLSNSFKYCTSGNCVNLEVNRLLVDSTCQYLTIKVTDNGQGMSKTELKKVFHRFYQSTTAKQINNGSGIGLSYVQNLVNLHHGTIKIESKPGNGTQVIVNLPCDIDSFEKNELAENIAESNTYTISDVILDKTSPLKFSSVNALLTDNNEKPSILIVEDNPELLDFLQESLNSNYQINTACNGKEALEILKNIHPELIISDIMMPIMDGLELTQTLKSNIETSHIPIILLTAKAGINNYYEGLIHGADIYLEKPFLPQILKQNIINIINTRRNAINKFSSDSTIKPSELTASAKDKEFINSLTQIIEENIDNSTMDVQFLVNKMHVSRSLIHMKLKYLLNCSTTEYIRIIRLRTAVNLITKEDYNYTEAAYKTGFTSLTYFSRAFKEQYGMSPRNYFNNKKSVV